MNSERKPVEVLRASEVEDVWKNYRKELYEYSLNLTRNAVLAEDLLQAAFLRLIHRVTQPYGYVWRNTVDRYLKRIMRNIFFNDVRKKQHEERAFALYREIRKLRFERKAVLQRALEAIEEANSLSERQKEVFHLRFSGKCQLNDIASLQGKSLATIKRDLLEARSYLRNLAEIGLFNLELEKHERISIAGLGREEET